MPAWIAARRDRMKAFAASFGITQMGSPDHIPNTRRALAMAEYARDHGKLDAFREAAMRAHWQEGKDIEKDQDLAAIAQKVGLDSGAALHAADDPQFQARVDAERMEGERKGVDGIPTFFIGKNEVVGCQPYEVLEQAAVAAGARRRRE